MTNRVLCKFFAHGACFKGDQCEFSHDWGSPANNVCSFYQKGVCSYGSRCRYDHVKPRKPEPPSSSSSSLLSSRTVSSTETAPPSKPCVSTGKPAWNDPNFTQGAGIGMAPTKQRPEDTPLCSFAAVGPCPRGEKCPHVHGDLCPLCGRNCLHPFRADEREEHMTTCEKKQKHINALKKSQDIECGVCLDRVLSKPDLSERKFGLLSNCDHAFCISCIRNWRSYDTPISSDTVRSCPVCRKQSHFVIPSVIWFTTSEEKQDIVQNYKDKLRSIDCKHFDFGKGNCPFGTSCFYKHAFRDRRLEEVVLRHLGSEDGQTVIAKDIRLCEFLSQLRI